MMTMVSSVFEMMMQGSFLLMVWPLLCIEMPRYSLLSLATMVERYFRGKRQAKLPKSFHYKPYSVIIVGHNQGDTLKNAVLVLEEQIVRPSEIIVVSDGSYDTTESVVNELLHEGRIQSAHNVDARNGKSASINLGISNATHDMVMVLDSDSALDRNAAREMLRYFEDSSVGAVSANIIPKGTARGIMHIIQRIEYGIALSLGRVVLDKLDIVSCVSGACGMYRKAALKQIYGFNAGSGEDLEVTQRVRNAGWRARFASEAVVSTNVPPTLMKYTLQRMRWERDTIGIRFRRHREVLLLGRGGLRPKEAFLMMEFIMFYVIPLVALPFYIMYLFTFFSHIALAILMAVLFCNLALDFFLIMIAQALGLTRLTFTEMLGIPLYSLFNLTYYRPLRLCALISEVLLRGSKDDEFVPAQVRRSLEIT